MDILSWNLLLLLCYLARHWKTGDAEKMFAREAIKLISAGVEFLSSECGGLYTLGFLYNPFLFVRSPVDFLSTPFPLPIIIIFFRKTDKLIISPKLIMQTFEEDFHLNKDKHINQLHIHWFNSFNKFLVLAFKFL